MEIKDKNVKITLESIDKTLLNAFKTSSKSNKDMHIIKAKGMIDTLLTLIEWGDTDER